MFSLCVTFRNLIAYYINTLFSSFVLGFVNLRKKLTEKRYLLIKIYRIETKEQKIWSILNKHLIYVTKEKDTKCDTFSMRWWQHPYLCSNINTTTYTHDLEHITQHAYTQTFPGIFRLVCSCISCFSVVPCHLIILCTSKQLLY